jgi:hypothetical protein
MRNCILIIACFVIGCSSDPVYLGDGGGIEYGTAPDGLPVCVGNNDGKIDINEVQFVTGVKVNYLFNPPGTTVPVNPDGPNWDFTSTEGVIHVLELDPVKDQWFASSFPGADYATVTDVGSGLLGVFKIANETVWIMGYASPTPDPETLLVYDTPIASLRFPISLGDSWTSVGRINGGKVLGQPVAVVDTYQIAVDKVGTANLPFLHFDNVMRIHVKVSELLAGGVAQTRTQYLFFHECYGELGRMVSLTNEVNDPFTTAGEVRHLTF